MEQVKHCIYCGKVTSRMRPFILNPRADEELYCCSLQCLNKSQQFLNWDMNHRTCAYLLLAVCVIFNMFSFGFYWKGVKQFLPMMGIGSIIFCYPFIFARYASYQPRGIYRTNKIVRVFGLLLIILSFACMIYSI